MRTTRLWSWRLRNLCWVTVGCWIHLSVPKRSGWLMGWTTLLFNDRQRGFLPACSATQTCSSPLTSVWCQSCELLQLYQHSTGTRQSTVRWLIISQTTKKFPTFNGTRRSINPFTTSYLIFAPRPEESSLHHPSTYL